MNSTNVPTADPTKGSALSAQLSFLKSKGESTQTSSANLIETVDDKARVADVSESARELVALLALLRERPQRMGWSQIATEVAIRGSAVEIWEEIFDSRQIGLFANTQDHPALAAAENEIGLWRSQDYRLTTVLDPDFPVTLRGIHEVPPILFYKGDLRSDEDAVSVVGSRKASDRGRMAARSIAEGLVERGIAVLSGLAAGIDAEAHRAVIAAGGRPVGVIGTGINKVYPAEHRDLHRSVAEHGVVMSQFLPDTPPTKSSFPMRNATMSGLGRATIVVEAGEHSGARIQARMAVAHGRPVVLTDLVVASTTWGRKLLSRPGVYQARGVAEVLAIVDDILEKRRNLLGGWLVGALVN